MRSTGGGRSDNRIFVSLCTCFLFVCRKQTEEGREAKKSAIWNALTLQPLRQRLTASNRIEEVKKDPDCTDVSEETEIISPEEEEKVEWTAIDWAIVAIKVLVWVCLQVRILFSLSLSLTL